MQYSTARMSLGRSSTPGSPPRLANARLRAAGKESPAFRWGRRAAPNWGESSRRAVSRRRASSAVSAPKERPSTPNRSKISTAPPAKPSADRRLTVTGSSSTRSAPASSAGPGPHLPGKHRRLPPLHIEPAHETHHGRLRMLHTQVRQLPGMAQMQGIVLTNDAHCPHRRDPPGFFQKIPKKDL